MLVDKEKIIEAKSKLKENMAFEIASDLHIEKWDAYNLRGCCPFHKEDTPSFIWNAKDNAFKCFGCGINYGALDHYIAFYNLSFLDAVKKLFSNAGIEYPLGEKNVKNKRNYKYPYHEYNDEKSKVIKYMGSRGISESTLNYTDIQADKYGNIVYHYYDSNDVLCLVKYRSAEKTVDKNRKFWSQKDSDTTPLLYNMNRIDPTLPLVICEGESDCLAIIESGYKNVVSVPFGSNNTGWIEENWEWLEQFDKIIIWSDSDDPGIKMRKDISARLGTWKTFYIDISTPLLKADGTEILCKDANEVLFYFDKTKVIDLIKNAYEFPVAGVLNLALVEDFDIEKAAGITTGLKKLDDIVYKFLFGNVVIITGKRGEGKSSLVNQSFICEGLEQGYDSFIFSGELSAPVLKSWIDITLAGQEKIAMDSRGIVHTIDAEARGLIKEWYMNRLWIYDNKHSSSAEDILEKAIAVTRKYGAKIWVLDNLLVMDVGSDSQTYERQKDFVAKLITLADLYNVLIVLVVHPRKTQFSGDVGADDVGGSGAITNLAQYVLATKKFSEIEQAGVQNKDGSYQRGKEPFSEDSSIAVLKNRYTGKTKDFKVHYEYKSRRYYNTAQELNKRYSWNISKEPVITTIVNANAPEWA
jgi:twinkle protein